MRYEASQYGDTELRGAPKKYFDKKVALTKEGKQDLLRTTDLPASPPSLDALNWGNLGVEDGLADYRSEKQKEPAKGTEADSLVKWMDRGVTAQEWLPGSGWLYRNLYGNPYAPTRNEDCRVGEPSLK